MRRGSLLALLIVAHLAVAQPAMVPGPLSPEDSRKAIKVRPGFTVELMAAEPLVMDPIAFAWSADGKLWVVEMGDYPLGVDGKNRPGGRVKCLTRSRDDGPYERATLFLDNLGYPTGVTPWKKGVLITCAPDIFYAEDTDGDGKADVKQLLFTGFGEGNQQHRVNGLVYGLDGWFYGANGDSGGLIKSLKTGQTVDIRGRDFRIKPDEGLIEPVTGQTQFGRARDDWGNWFGCSNSRPLFHFVLEDRYLRRNPHVIYPAPRVEVIPGPIAVFPASKSLPRFNDYYALNHFTSACGLTLYRDELFGPEFANNAFVSEPVHNLVHRSILKPQGLTFTAQRADDEKDREFLASTDNWFRPTMLQTGPDGALWVADMYRYVIEHPQWIPKDWQAKLDLRAGHDKGRIYRVFPTDRKPRPIPHMDRMNPAQLTKGLANSNGWVRDTAQQLLIAHGDEGLIHGLIDLASTSDNPKARLHADATLEGILNSPREPLPKPNEEDLFKRHISRKQAVNFIKFHALRDSHPDVARAAVAITERLSSSFEPSFSIGPLLSDLLVRRGPLNAKLRLQLAFSFGGAGEKDLWGLAWLLRQDPNDPYQQAAVWSSVNRDNWPAILDEILQSPRGIPEVWIPTLVRIAHGFDNSAATARLLQRLIGANVSPDRFAQVAPILESLDVSKLSKDPTLKPAIDRINKTLALARKIAADPKAPLGERALALPLLGREAKFLSADRKVLAAFLTPQTPDDLQAAAIARLGQMGANEAVFFQAWKSLGPTQRAQVLDALLSRPAGVNAVLDAVEKQTLLPQDLDAARRQRLLQNSNGKVRERSAALFATGSQPDRARVVDEYKAQLLTLDRAGDVERGGKVFAKSCAACHQFGGLGQPVGPDLKSVGDKSSDGLLVALFDPNRAVEPRYLNYLVTTRSGLTITGILAGETSTGLTVLSADGMKHELLRQEVEELVGTGKSLMPEGLERDLSPQDVADLFAFLRRHWSAESAPARGER